MAKKHKAEKKSKKTIASGKSIWWLVGLIIAIFFLLNITGKSNLIKSIFNRLIPTPTPTPKPVQISPAAGLDTDQANYVKLAVEDLSAKLGIKSGDIKVVSVRDKQWNDSSLGCPKRGMLYVQSITPGFIIELYAQGKTYIYHAGLNVVLSC